MLVPRHATLFLIACSLLKVKVREGPADLGPKHSSQQLRSCDPRLARAAAPLAPRRRRSPSGRPPLPGQRLQRPARHGGTAPSRTAAPRGAHARRCEGGHRLWGARSPPPPFSVYTQIAYLGRERVLLCVLDRAGCCEGIWGCSCFGGEARNAACSNNIARIACGSRWGKLALPNCLQSRASCSIKAVC